MLLNHTSGLGRYDDDVFYDEVIANPRRRWSVAELLDRAAAQPRFAAPGVRHAYSNTNYNLLGLVLEHATGKPWRTVVRERVIDRLGLRHTSLPEPGHTPAGRDIARAYEHVDGALRDVTDVDSSMAGAAGGHALLTTTADLSRFLDGLLDGKLFRHRRTLRQMRSVRRGAEPGGPGRLRARARALRLRRHRDGRAPRDDGRLPRGHGPPARAAHRPSSWSPRHPTTPPRC